MIISLKKQNGFSAILAIVILVLFTLIGTYMLTLTSVSSISTGISGAAIQAWFAARSGVEWAIHQSLSLASCVGVDGQTINFSSGGLNGFQADISCTETTGISEGPSIYNIYNIDVTASRGTVGQESYVSRNIVVTLTDRNAP